MTVARSVGDVLAEHVAFEVDCIDRERHLNVYVPDCGLRRRPGGRAMCTGSWSCPLPRLRRWPGSPTCSAPRCAGSPASTLFRRCELRQGRAQATTSCTNTSCGSSLAPRGCCSSGGRREKTNLFRTERRRDANG